MEHIKPNTGNCDRETEDIRETNRQETKENIPRE